MTGIMEDKYELAEMATKRAQEGANASPPPMVGKNAMANAMREGLEAADDKVHELFGHEGFFGQEGEDSLHWKDLKGIPANDIMAKTDFEDHFAGFGRQEDTYGIDNEAAVNKTKEYLNGLMTQSGIKPGTGETLEQFMDRAHQQIEVQEEFVAATGETTQQVAQETSSAQPSGPEKGVQMSLEEVREKFTPWENAESSTGHLREIEVHTDTLSAAERSALARDVLKPGWQDALADKSPQNIAALEGHAANISAMEKVKDAMGEVNETVKTVDGVMKKPEFIQKQIERQVANIEKTFGNMGKIFKI
jgi:hypothetical protein